MRAVLVGLLTLAATSCRADRDGDQAPAEPGTGAATGPLPASLDRLAGLAPTALGDGLPACSALAPRLAEAWRPLGDAARSARAGQVAPLAAALEVAAGQVTVAAPADPDLAAADHELAASLRDLAAALRLAPPGAARIDNAVDNAAASVGKIVLRCQPL